MSTPVVKPSREQVMAEREAKKLAKQKKKLGSDGQPSAATAKPSGAVAAKENVKPSTEAVPTQKPKKATKPEPTAIKVEAPKESKKDTVTVRKTTSSSMPKTDKVKQVNRSDVTHQSTKLFRHLHRPVRSTKSVDPLIYSLGMKYERKIIVGSNARCLAFLNTVKQLIKDYTDRANNDFARGIELLLNPSVEHLQMTRPLAVSINNALKHLKWQNTQPFESTDDIEKKNVLIDCIDTYIRDHIEKAALAICGFVQQKICRGDTILIYGCSSLVEFILYEAHVQKVQFKVFVVDSRPTYEGQEMIRRLSSRGIDCTCILINAISFIMPEVTKVFLSAHALLANGYVMSRVGSAQIALLSKYYNVPTLVCCETHKFSERVQTDAIVNNELSGPNEFTLQLNQSNLGGTIRNDNIDLLNLRYDVTAPELVSGVVTELGILPCTSVPVILRIKPSEIGF